MNIKTRKYIYRICIAVADAHVPDEETGDANSR
jgi:hypothetical protein